MGTSTLHLKTSQTPTTISSAILVGVEETLVFRATATCPTKTGKTGTQTTLSRVVSRSCRSELYTIPKPCLPSLTSSRQSGLLSGLRSDLMDPLPINIWLMPCGKDRKGSQIFLVSLRVFLLGLMKLRMPFTNLPQTNLWPPPFYRPSFGKVLPETLPVSCTI